MLSLALVVPDASSGRFNCDGEISLRLSRLMTRCLMLEYQITKQLYMLVDI